MDVERLADEIIDCAKARGLTISTAESCSAGRLAFALSTAEGDSKYFLGGIVAYTKEMKIRMLGVPASAIERGTAVCAEVAEAMAQGAVSRSGADFGISITGVAGPEPDEDGNPVGLVYCGVARRDGLTDHVRLSCEETAPEKIVDQACRKALLLLRTVCLQSAANSTSETNVAEASSAGPPVT
jgi:PncC family amidohydrolase